MTVREELAREIAKSQGLRAPWRDWHPLSQAPFLRRADAILASDWLARRDAEVAAKALEDAADAARAERDRCGEIRVVSGCYIRREPFGYRYWGEAARALTDRAAALRASSLGAENPETTDSTNGAPS